MEILGLEKVERELKTASQSLWDFRSKEQPHAAVANLLESAQEHLAALRLHLADCREFLATWEEI